MTEKEFFNELEQMNLDESEKRQVQEYLDFWQEWEKEGIDAPMSYELILQFIQEGRY